MSVDEPMSEERLAELERDWSAIPAIHELVAEVRGARALAYDRDGCLYRDRFREQMSAASELLGRVEELEQAVQRVRELADTLNSWHDGSLVTSDYPMIARRIRLALDGGGA